MEIFSQFWYNKGGGTMINKMNTIKIFGLMLLLLVIFVTGCKRKSIHRLLAEGKYEEAETFCEKWQGKTQIDCYLIIASHYNEKEKYKKAAEFYDKAGEYITALNLYLRADAFPEAESYCQQQTGDIKIQCAAALARRFYMKGNYEKAITYFRTANNNQMAAYVMDKIPVFQLKEEVAEMAKSIKEPGTRTKLADIDRALRAYIYMDNLKKWSHGVKIKPHQRAAKLYQKALKMIETDAAPDFIQEVKNILSTSQWTPGTFESSDFPGAKLESLIKLAKYINMTANQRKFFNQYADKTSYFDEAYNQTLAHADSLFETIEWGRGETGKKVLKNYEEDLAIDINVMDYISNFLQNMQIRIMDIEKRSKGKKKKQASEKLFWDFIAVTNDVLHAIGEEKYEEANRMLTSGYQSVKKKLIPEKKSN
jgi:tetratricopeptide (TPR) repeat protein